MKALLVLAAVAGTAFVGYSYTSTDGQTCAVCPLTGEPLMTSTESEGACCASQNELMLTAVEGEAATCCSQAEGACCSKGEEGTCTKGESCCQKAGEAMLTSATNCEEKGCTKGCCSDKAEIAAEETGSEEAETVTEVAETE